MSKLNWRRMALPLLAAAILIAGCSSGAGNDEQGGEPTKLKVMYYHEQSFHSQYGMLYYALHPNVDIEVVSTQSLQPGPEEDYQEMLAKFIEEEQPDVLMLNPDQYEEFAADGKIASLDPYVTQDKFDLEGLVPGMVDYLKEKAGGELYGLTPQFYSQAIYYNKDLFDKYNIDYPTDKMSWEELLQLAQRFPTTGSDEDRIYGLQVGYMSDLSQLGSSIGNTLGLKLLNAESKQVTANTDSWVRAYETAHKAIESGALYSQNPNMPMNGSTYEEYLLSQPFIGGKVAMAMDGSYFISQIEEAARALPDKAVKNWDLVTTPVDPSNPDVSNNVSFYNIFAINNASANKDAAWDFIKYIHGDEYARVTSKTGMNGNFPVRTKYIENEDGRNLAAFYALKPSMADPYAGFDELPQDFYMQSDSISREELGQVTAGTKTVAEALASMQTRLQAALDQAIANAPAEEAEGGAVQEPASSDAGSAGSDGATATETESSAESTVQAE